MMLNERQKSLYKFLIDKATTNEFISKEEICTSLQELYPRNEEKTNEHASSSFSRIRKDVRTINGSDAYKIIVSNHKGYKVANEQEAIDYLDRRFKRDLKSLKINWNLRNKINRNGQLTVTRDDFLNEIQTFFKEGNDVGSKVDQDNN